MNRQLRVPAVTLTTRHSAAVYPWTQPPALPADGALIGVDVLAGVAEPPLRPGDSLAAVLATAAPALAAAVRPVEMQLHRLLAGHLAGMVNGPSTIRLDPTAPGVVVDLSRLRVRDALAAVMV